MLKLDTMNRDYLSRDKRTEAKHKRDVLWQIWLPLGIGILAVLGLAGWVIVNAAQGADLRQTADASLIFLLIPLLVMALIPLILLSVLVYATIWLHRNLPFYAYRVQTAMTRLQQQVQRFSDRLVAPIIRSRELQAGLRHLLPRKFKEK